MGRRKFGPTRPRSEIYCLEPAEMFGEATFASREGPSSYAQAIAPSKAAFLTCLTMKELREVGAVGHASQHIVVEDTEALQRIAEDTA